MDAVIITVGLLCAIDLVIYFRTPYIDRRHWPWWRFLPGGAIIAKLFYGKKKE